MEDEEDEYYEAPECFFCDEPLTEEDEHDSGIVGNLPRCRAHILAVAPELLTVDAIIHDRAA